MVVAPRRPRLFVSRAVYVSALFLLVESWTEDKVMDEIKGFDAEVLQTSLSKEDEAKLAAAFGAEE